MNIWWGFVSKLSLDQPSAQCSQRWWEVRGDRKVPVRDGGNFTRLHSIQIELQRQLSKPMQAYHVWQSLWMCDVRITKCRQVMRGANTWEREHGPQGSGGVSYLHSGFMSMRDSWGNLREERTRPRNVDSVYHVMVIIWHKYNNIMIKW
jgi:hypothetical protein